MKGHTLIRHLLARLGAVLVLAFGLVFTVPALVQVASATTGTLTLTTDCASASGWHVNASVTTAHDDGLTHTLSFTPSMDKGGGWNVPLSQDSFTATVTILFSNGVHPSYTKTIGRPGPCQTLPPVTTVAPPPSTPPGTSAPPTTPPSPPTTCAPGSHPGDENQPPGCYLDATPVPPSDNTPPPADSQRVDQTPTTGPLYLPPTGPAEDIGMAIAIAGAAIAGGLLLVVLMRRRGA